MAGKSSLGRSEGLMDSTYFRYTRSVLELR